jgi:hypothetical protein
MTTGIQLGKAGTAPPFGTDVISATYTEECETIDVSNRGNVGTGAVGYRAFDAGFKSKLWEIECHDATGLIAKLESNTADSDFIVMSVTENISIDGAVTFTVTAREGGL